MAVTEKDREDFLKRMALLAETAAGPTPPVDWTDDEIEMALALGW